MITIHNFPRGARGVRVAWVCEEMGLAYTSAAVSFPPSADYKARNPLGTVPFLEDEGGVAIAESVAMMLYLAERYGPTPLLPPKSDPAFARVLQLTLFGEATLAAPMNPLIMTRFMAPDAEKTNWTAGALETRVAQAVEHVAAVLGDKPYLAGDGFTLADISVSCALDMWQGALKKDVPDRLSAWRARVKERPAYQRAQAAQSQA
ncbi:MAG TPA: glutathione S-transferase family protein [Rhizomicrobium sp.]|jgi:glutathione S-transferase|nr:glutathione S-transferase family protein [Rhizomicrobium sp.]